MLYLIGLGLDVGGISVEGLEIVKRCKQVYFENYTVDFPYTEGELSEVVGKKIISADRKFVEGLSIVDDAKKKDVALLIYGSPLTATTHVSLIQECRRLEIKCKVIYAASIFDAVAGTGLQLYKFGKIASMPAWKTNYEPDSFMKIIQENLSMKAHSLILMDIGLDFPEALEQLEKAARNQKVSLGKLVVCQRFGTKRAKFFYKNFEEFKEFDNVLKPYCIVIPSKLHFVEKEMLEG